MFVKALLFMPVEVDSSITSKEYKENSSWGLHLVVDAHSCKEEIVKDKEKIKEFIVKLCDVIGMKRFGDVIVERFGKDELEGYTAVQLIETSSITAHFEETKNNAYIDIFSCSFFDVKKALNYIEKELSPSSMDWKVLLRK